MTSYEFCSYTDSLVHHGIKGQKWGIRRYQNPDGTLTDEGRRRVLSRQRSIRASKTQKGVEDVVKSLSKEERRLFGMRDDEKEYLSDPQLEYVVKRFTKSEDGKIVSFLDLLRNGDDLEVAIATDSNYRGRGYAKTLSSEAIKWYEKNKKYANSLIWDAQTKNVGSISIAKDLGFKFEKEHTYDNNKHSLYRYK